MVKCWGGAHINADCIHMHWANILGTCPHTDSIHLQCTKSKGHAYTLMAHTRGGKKFKGHAYMLMAYTCGRKKSKGQAYMLLTYT